MSTPAELMLTEALAAQKFTRKFFVVELDFAEHTIGVLDEQCKAASYALRGGLTPENIDKLTQLWGAYFGEVIRRNSAGQWSAISVDGVDKYVLEQGEVRVFPHDLVRQRLVEGPNASLAASYATTKTSLT